MFVSLLQLMGFPLTEPVHLRAVETRPDQPTPAASQARSTTNHKQATSARRDQVNAKPTKPLKSKSLSSKAAAKPASKVTKAAPKATAKTQVKASSKSPPRQADARAKVPVKTPVKAPAKTPAKAPGKAAVKAPGKSANKAVAKAAPKSVSKAGTKPAAKPPTKATSKAANKKVAKADTKPKAKATAKATAKPSSKVSKVISKKTTTPVAAKTATKKSAPSSAKSSPGKPIAPAPLKSVKPTPASKAVVKPAAKAATKPPAQPVATPQAAGPSTPVATPKPAMSIPAAPAALPQKSARPSARLAQLTVPSMAQSVASTAAKASYSPTIASAVVSPVTPVAVKKDPKLANNWKTKPAAELTDAELLAMPDAEYMNEVQMAAFRLKLLHLKKDILSSAGETTEHLREDTSVVPDPADRATIEEEHALELRTRDRERKLLKKIEQSIARIDSGDYGYCDETGEPIGVGRLLARPTANLTLEAQQRRELKQKMFGD